MFILSKTSLLDYLGVHSTVRRVIAKILLVLTLAITTTMTTTHGKGRQKVEATDISTY